MVIEVILQGIVQKEEDQEDIMIEDIGVEVEVDNIGEEEIVIVEV